MSVVASDRFRKDDDETVLSCTLPGQAYMNTNPTCRANVPVLKDCGTIRSLPFLFL